MNSARIYSIDEIMNITDIKNVYIIKYKNNIPFLCDYDFINKLINYLKIILENQIIDIEYDFIEYELYNNSVFSINNENNIEKYKLEKYREFIKKFNIHIYSENLLKYNITKKEDSIMSDIIYLISNWI